MMTSFQYGDQVTGLSRGAEVGTFVSRGDFAAAVTWADGKTTFEPIDYVRLAGTGRNVDDAAMDASFARVAR